MQDDQSFDDFIDGLMNNDEPIPTKRSTQKKYPCPQCAGTGVYQSVRVHQEKSHCFACRGTGFFKTDPRKLQENRVKAAAKRQAAKAEATQANLTADGGSLHKWLEANADWNGFAASLMQQSMEGKRWTENQIGAARRMMAKTEATREKKAAERKKASVSVDLQPIRDMFEKALENGHKRPTYRAEGLVINRASSYGANPGALYVKDEAGEYMGKIIGTTFTPARNAAPAGQALLQIAENPLEAAVRYGRKTGRCACCGRELTNKLSIELGIGPICRDKWGL